MKPSALAFMLTLASLASWAEDKALPELPELQASLHTLPNGLTVIVREDPASPIASIQAWCATGSIHEGRWLGAGLSHILEHMLFKGTETRKPGDIARHVHDQGGQINAYTSFDRTVYWIDVPASGAMEALDILADAMLHATLPEEEYAKEQEVIRREIAMGQDDPHRQSLQLMLRTVFAESPFRHPIIGYLDVFNQLTRQDVLDYYRQRYVPNNITFVVVGPVQTGEVLQRLESLFAGAPRRALEPVFIASEPAQMGRRDAHVEFPGTELTRLALAWRIPGLDHPDTPALDVLGSILGGGASSPLTQEVRERKRLVHSIGAGMYSLQSDGVFAIMAACEPSKREEAEAAAIEVLERLKNEGPTAAELERAKRRHLASQIAAWQTARGQASDLGGNWFLARNLDFSRHYLGAVAALTPADIQRVARAHLDLDRLCSTSLNPPGSLAQAARPKETVAKTAPSTEMFTLPNGLRVIVREDRRLPLVILHAAFLGGVLAETPETNGLTRLMASVLPKGTTRRSAREWAELIEGAGGSFSTDSANNSWSATVRVMAPDVELGMDALADMIRQPAFDPGEIETERASLLAAIKAEDEQITSAARNLTREAFFGSHPYALRSLGSEEAVRRFTREDLQAIHRRLAAARNGVLALAGDVSVAEARRLAEKYFADLPEGEPALASAQPPTPPTEPVETQRTLDKQQAVVMFAFPGPAAASEDRLPVALLLEASNSLGSRFYDRIREQMGLAYFVGASQLSGPVPGCQIFFLGTDPARLEEVTVAFREEIAKLASEGLTEEELERAKRKFLGQAAIRRQSLEGSAAKAALDELLGLGYDAQERLEKEVNAVTLEQVREAARKYLGAPGFVKAIVRPPAPGT